MASIRSCAVVAWFLLLAASSSAYAKKITFTIAPSGSEVTFLSTAPLESFKGKTDQLLGQFTLDPDSLHAGIDGELMVDMTSLSTGLAIRDEHMRQNHLETDQFPTSVFHPTSISDDVFSLISDTSVVMELAGEFTLHGVTRKIKVDINATWHPSKGKLEVKAGFPVALADYKIARPQFLAMKLGKVQQVTVRFTADTDSTSKSTGRFLSKEANP